MKYILKPGQRIDKLKSEIRPLKKGRAGKFVYLALLGSLVLTLFDVLAGDLIYFRADGLVTQRATIITPDYTGTISALRVSTGDHVKAGQEVALVRSQQMLKDIAQLLAKLLDAEAGMAQLRIRRGNLARLIPEARKHVKATRAYRRDITKLNRDGWATSRQSNATIREDYNALEKFITLESEVNLIDKELANSLENHSRLKGSLEKLESLYNNGRLTALEEGISLCLSAMVLLVTDFSNIST